MGTLALLLGGLSAIVLDFAPRSPVVAHIPSSGLRLSLTGILFAGSGALVAVSALGRLSGAHLNPAVSLAFWIDGKLAGRDLLGYVSAQLIGALAAAALVRAIWGGWAMSVSGGATVPRDGIGIAGTLALEALLTMLLLLALFLSLSSARAARYTPLVAFVLVAALVRLFGHWGGPSMNPARSLGPGLVFGRGGVVWPYLLAPLLGAGAFMLLWRYALTEREVLTAKLFHDPRYRSILGTRLAAEPSDGPMRRRGEAVVGSAGG